MRRPGRAGDRTLSDAEWAQVAAGIMRRTGLATEQDELGVRWVAVRHAADHVHVVATLARQDGGRPRIWNDFYRVREACHDAERRFGLRSTAPADRTATRCSTRAESEQAARRGWDETPRARLRREVSIAAAGARTEQEFFTRLQRAGVAVRKRLGTINPGEVTGYAVGLPQHTTKDGGIVWYGGGKLAADLTLPKLRRRWDPPEITARAWPGASRFTVPDRNAIYAHAASQAAFAAEHIRYCSATDPSQAADAAWAAATRCTRRPGHFATRYCVARLTPTTGPLALLTVASPNAPPTGCGCVPQRGYWRWPSTAWATQARRQSG